MVIWQEYEIIIVECLFVIMNKMYSFKTHWGLSGWCKATVSSGIVIETGGVLKFRKMRAEKNHSSWRIIMLRMQWDVASSLRFSRI